MSTGNLNFFERIFTSVYPFRASARKRLHQNNCADREQHAQHHIRRRGRESPRLQQAARLERER